MNQEQEIAMLNEIRDCLTWFCVQGLIESDVSDRIYSEIDSIVEEHLHACRRRKPIPLPD